MPADIVDLDRSTAALLDNVAPDVFDGPIDPHQLRDFLQDPRHVMVLAVETDRVVGMASGVEYLQPDKPPQFWINEVGVSPAHQNRGIGRALTAALITRARARGCSYAWLATDRDNARAQACYRAVPQGDAPEEAMIFGWDLDA